MTFERGGGDDKHEHDDEDEDAWGRLLSSEWHLEVCVRVVGECACAFV